MNCSVVPSQGQNLHFSTFNRKAVRMAISPCYYVMNIAVSTGRWQDLFVKVVIMKQSFSIYMCICLSPVQRR